MLLNVLNQYLQNQLNQPAVSGVAATNTKAASTATTNSDPYEPSARAIMISAVATEFDVTDLSSEDLNHLQDRLQQYGLLNQSDVRILARLHVRDPETGSRSTAGMPSEADTADTELPIEETGSNRINAFDDINRLRAEEAGSMPYQSRQALYRVQTLIHNLESAARSLTGATLDRQLN